MDMTTPDTWFHRLLVDHADKLGGQKALADKLGVGKSLVNSWLAGGKVETALQIEEVVRALGGDISRALPDYEPDAVGNITIEGRVTANSQRYSSDDEKREVEGGLLGYLKTSKLFGLTTAPTCFIQVEGDSMAPDYPEGCLLVCRRPEASRDLPQNTPVIVSVDGGGDRNFKMLQRVDGYTNLVPINVRSHDVQTFKTKDVRVEWVVIGRIIPNELDRVRKGAIMRRSKKRKAAEKDVEV